MGIESNTIAAIVKNCSTRQKGLRIPIYKISVGVIYNSVTKVHIKNMISSENPKSINLANVKTNNVIDLKYKYLIT